jgi:6-phosphogluconolactonase
MPPSPPEIRIVEDVDALARAAAEEFAHATDDAIRARAGASVALSGGSTPRHLYRALASDAYRDRIAWERIHFFFGDERHAPPEDPESNFGIADEALLSKVHVPADHIHRIPGEDPDADRAARLYERGLVEHFRLGAGELPRFDLALLGLGSDGHTASLFPETMALSETRRLAVANRVDKLDSERITLTAPVFNHAALVIFLVSGETKAAPLKAVLEGPYDPTRLPAQLIRPDPGRLLWLADRPAAARLQATAGRTG